jgi:hypothetical protein
MMIDSTNVHATFGNRITWREPLFSSTEGEAEGPYLEKNVGSFTSGVAGP